MRIFGKSAIAAGLVGVIGLGMTFGGAAAANASSPTVLSGAGSDTIYFVMAGSPAGAAHPHTGLDAIFNGSQSATTVTEIPPSNSSIGGFPSSVTVPADAGCPTSSPWNSNGSYTWDTSDAAHTPPNGSSAGITALQNDDASAHPGCLVDFARSSRGLGNPSDTADLESYAFALDAVDWAIIGSGANKNKNAPTTLSVSQLTKIYTCGGSGTPIYSNWDQVGGKNAPIIKFAPQTGSGTLSFFQTKLLGGATVDSGCNASNLSIRAEENQLTNLCTGNDPTCNSGQSPIPAADLSKLISPFSYAKYNSQKAGSEPDLRNGVKLEKLEGIAPTKTTVNEGLGSGPHFLGTRYVYNIITQNEPTYAASASYLGINQAGTPANGMLCSDSAAAAAVKLHKAVLKVDKEFGFTPLTDQVEGSGQPTGYCRFDATPL